MKNKKTALVFGIVSLINIVAFIVCLASTIWIENEYIGVILLVTFAIYIGSGIMCIKINSNSKSYISKKGIISNIDTSKFKDGDKLYLDPNNPGSLTTDSNGYHVGTIHKIKKNWISIRKAKNCLFSRRNGYIGKIVLGYSISLRIFNCTII